MRRRSLEARVDPPKPRIRLLAGGCARQVRSKLIALRTAAASLRMGETDQSDEFSATGRAVAHARDMCPQSYAQLLWITWLWTASRKTRLWVASPSQVVENGAPGRLCPKI